MKYAKYKIEKLGFSDEKTKKFEILFLLTNKRWIQKAPYFILRDLSLDYSDSIIQKNDIVLGKLDKIDTIILKSYYNNYSIEFYVNGKDLPDFYVSFDKDETDYKKLVEILKEFFVFENIGNKKDEEVGFYIYSCRMKDKNDLAYTRLSLRSY